MRRLQLVMVIAGLTLALAGFLLTCFIPSKPSAPKAPYSPNSSGDLRAYDIAREINKIRLGYNLNELSYAPVAQYVAWRRALNVLEFDSFTHDESGPKPRELFRELSISPSGVGEVVAEGFDDKTSIVEAWMNSETHREVLLEPEYKYIGIGLQRGILLSRDSIVIVGIFIY